jgi:hypothetical protein
MLREYIVEGLQQHFHARVELDSFHLSLRGGLSVEGKGLRIWPPDRMAQLEVPGSPDFDKPLIELAEFRFHAPLHYKRGEVVRISLVRLSGLEIHVPPRAHKPLSKNPEEAATNDNPVPSEGRVNRGLLQFNIASVQCEDAHLTLETDKPGKLPLVFAIAHLKLTDLSSGGAMAFQAELTNPRPQGLIHTKGNFGPWMVDDPGESPVDGEYQFDHANLGDFKGIAGILSSTGKYHGTLRDIVADGETRTPDFRLTHFGTALPLETKFHARIDGTNGDTFLEPVEATLGGSHFWVRGQVVRATVPDGKNGLKANGHDITLTVNVDQGKMEDFLRLASKSGTPLLNGTLTTKAQVEIPPGPVPVDERIRIKGQFELDDAEFTSETIREKIQQLSARGQGHPKEAKDPNQPDVLSTMIGSYEMKNARVTLPSLVYTVPGAVIEVNGTYTVDGGALDFKGKAKMDATISAMVGGWKGFLLKPVDRYFKKDGAGTEVPISIYGTRESPHFSVDIKGFKHSSPQRSGDNDTGPVEKNAQ